MSNNSIYTIYKLLNTKGIGSVTASKLLNSIESDFFKKELPSEKVKSILDPYLSVNQINSFLESDEELINQVDKISTNKGGFFHIQNKEYPTKLKNTLGRKTPPILSYLGNSELLKSPSIGFCGSRKASKKGLAVANDCSQQMSENGIVVISGYATGVDLETHYATLNNKGKTIIVLPYGLEEFRIRKRLKDVWNWDNVLVISEFVPNAIWTASRAMKRNNTIIGLSDAMVLIESSEKGGSMDAGKKTLNLDKRLFAPVYKDMPSFAIGNQILIEKGAIPIMKSKKTGRANISKIIEHLLDHQHRVKEEQLNFL